MAFLTLNGLDIRVTRSNEQQDGLIIMGRTINGSVFDDHRTRARRWTITTALYPLTGAHALCSFLEGRGHSFSFDAQVFSEKGLGWTTDPDLGSTVPDPKFGPIRAHTVGTETIITGYTIWTVAYWFWTGAAWQHRIKTSDGRQWQDFVPGSYVWTINLTGGALLFSGGYYDDLVVLPYEITNAMGDSWPQTVAYSALPRLNAGGEFYELNTVVEVRAKSPKINGVVSAMLDGEFQRCASVSFELLQAKAGAVT